MSFKKQLFQIDIKYKTAVQGWIRNHKKQYKLLNIPDIIKALCILYYDVKEKFNECVTWGNIITKINDRDTYKVNNYLIHCVSNYDCHYKDSIFGSINVNQNNYKIMKWIFHINHHKLCMNRYIEISIGLSNKFNIYSYGCVTLSSSSEGYSRILSVRKDYYPLKLSKYIPCKCITEDAVIVMTFNRTDKILQFQKNDSDIITLKDIHFHHQPVWMVVNLSGSGFDSLKDVTITLSDFSIHY